MFYITHKNFNLLQCGLKLCVLLSEIFQKLNWQISTDVCADTAAVQKSLEYNVIIPQRRPEVGGINS